MMLRSNRCSVRVLTARWLAAIATDLLAAAAVLLLTVAARPCVYVLAQHFETLVDERQQRYAKARHQHLCRYNDTQHLRSTLCHQQLYTQESPAVSHALQPIQYLLQYWPSRSSKVNNFYVIWKPMWDFLLVINSNLGPILHRIATRHPLQTTDGCTIDRQTTTTTRPPNSIAVERQKLTIDVGVECQLKKTAVRFFIGNPPS